MPDIYNFTKSIDQQIVKAVSAVLRAPVLKSKRMKAGEINYVYKLQLPKQTVIARVFRYVDQPATGMFEWLEKQLTKSRIPHAKMIYYSRNNRYFPNGFMISEFVEGLNGWDAIKKGKHTIAKSYEATGRILRQVHEIRLPKYGAINNGKGEYKDYIKMELSVIHCKWADLAKKKVIDSELLPSVEYVIKEKLTQYVKLMPPTLIHADASRENSILTPDGKFILVDWDNARSGIWMWDFIELSWWWLHLREWREEGVRRVARKSFFKGYGKIPFTSKQVNEIQEALHLIKSIEKMHYYYFDKRDIKNFKFVKKIFLSMLA